MSAVDYRLWMSATGVLTVDGVNTSSYSERVVRLLIERRRWRAALYFPFKATRG
jgi:hypothetical protein